jgi:hypothetical protein
MLRRLIVVSLFVAGCFSPKYRSGDLQCSPSGACPPGMSCIAGHCYAPGDGPDLGTSIDNPPPDLADATDLFAPGDMAQTPADLNVPPMSYPPAAVWTSSGGGAAVGSATGALLNISIGGTIAPGDVTGSAGATATFGYFSNDIIQ